MTPLQLISKAKSFVRQIRALFAKNDPDPPPSPAAVSVPPSVPPDAGTPAKQVAIQSAETFEGRLVRQCDLIARNAADIARSPKHEPTVARALDERAQMVALAATAPLFDPANNLADQRTMIQLAQLEERETELAEHKMIAWTEFRRRSDELSRTEPPGPKPVVSAVLVGTAVAGLTLAFGPVVHDLLRGMLPFLRWVLAIGIGASLGLFLVEAMMLDYGGAMRGKGVTAGALLAIGFLITRISIGGWRAAPLGLGSAVIEMSVMLYLDAAAAQFASRMEDWRVLNQLRRKAEDLMEDARHTLQRIEAELAEVKKDIAGIVESNMKGRVWWSDLEKNQKLAVTAVRTAYALRMAENRTLAVVPREAA